MRLRTLLESRGAAFEGRKMERNWLYDYTDRTLFRSGKALRLRQDKKVTLTFKGPREESDIKKREELEIEFPNVSVCDSLLISVGFVKWFYYEKIRETWTLRECEIVLDELPDLGVFVEIEGPSAETIEKTVKALKLPRRYIPQTYMEMLLELSNGAGRSMREFKFSPQHEYVLGSEKDPLR